MTVQQRLKSGREGRGEVWENNPGGSETKRKNDNQKKESLKKNNPTPGVRKRTKGKKKKGKKNTKASYGEKEEVHEGCKEKRGVGASSQQKGLDETGWWVGYGNSKEAKTEEGGVTVKGLVSRVGGSVVRTVKKQRKRGGGAGMGWEASKSILSYAGLGGRKHYRRIGRSGWEGGGLWAQLHLRSSG